MAAQYTGTDARVKPHTELLVAQRYNTTPKGDGSTNLHQAAEAVPASRTCSPAIALLSQALRRFEIIEAVRLLRDCHDPSGYDEYGYTPLHVSAEEGLNSMVVALARAGANLESRSLSAEDTPLLVSVKSNQTSTSLLLLDLGALPNVADRTGISAVQLVAQIGNARLLLALLRKGACVDYTSSLNGWTALHIAASCNHPVALSVLMHYGANVNAHHLDGNTPLMMACSGGYVDCVQQLLSGGADVNIINRVSSMSCWYPSCYRLPARRT